MSVLIKDNDIGNEGWTFIWATERKVIILAETKDV
jgi:hypothetical protein